MPRSFTRNEGFFLREGPHTRRIPQLGVGGLWVASTAVVATEASHHRLPVFDEAVVRHPSVLEGRVVTERWCDVPLVQEGFAVLVDVVVRPTVAVTKRLYF